MGTHRARLAVAVSALAALLAVVGCGGGPDTLPPTETFTCDPACPAGQKCTALGCELPDGGILVRDLSVTLDGGGPCPVACQGATPYCKGMACVVCLVDANCPTGQICRSVGSVTACIPGCNDDARCGTTDGGAPMKCCGGQCVNSGTDPLNCGACATACSSAHAGASCSGGICVAGKCAAGWADCNMDPKDGCETKLDYDPMNCGGCGMPCKFANAIAGCGPSPAPGTSGCYIQACAFGFDDCNGMPGDGCETSTLSDVKNCGGCGMLCGALPNAMVGCVNAVCGLIGCKQGWFDCDGLAKNGCETAVKNDRNNCGKCGAACGQGQVCINGGCTCANCQFNNAKSKCVNNMCVFDQCVDGFGDCNNNVNDGCESDLSGDKNNCGACGNACDQNTPYCYAGKCTKLNTNILICYASPYEVDVKSMLTNSGAFMKVDEMNCGQSTPTLQQLQPYGAVLVYSDNQFQSPQQLGDVMADYFDGGGSVVVATFANASLAITGRFGNVGNGYMMVQPGGQEEPNDSLGGLDEPNSPLVKDVMNITATAAYRSTGGVVNGGTVVAHWASGKPMVVRGTAKGRNLVSLNFYPPSNGARKDFVTGDVMPLLRNAMLYR
jgi:hypothetical protein